MSARAVWKGTLVLGAQRVSIKMFSAVEDQAIHFHLLHDKDLSPVDQRIVRKDTGREVPKEDQRKAFPLDEDRAVILEAEELEQLEPEAGREVCLLRFVPQEALGDTWFDRPYYLGPDDDEQTYFALVQALQGKQLMGIARWTMREKRYLGAVSVVNGYLMMTTLRRAEQILQVPAVRPDKARAPTPAEVKLAQQLVDSISGAFEPERWHNEYRERLRKLVQAKASGRTLKLVKPEPKEATTDLTEALRASLAQPREKKRA